MTLALLLAVAALAQEDWLEEEEDFDLPDLGELLAEPSEPCPRGFTRAPDKRCIPAIDEQLVADLLSWRQASLALCELPWDAGYVTSDKLFLYLFERPSSKHVGSTWLLVDSAGWALPPALARELPDDPQRVGSAFSEQGLKLQLFLLEGDLTALQTGESVDYVCNHRDLPGGGSMPVYCTDTTPTVRRKELRDLDITEEPSDLERMRSFTAAWNRGVAQALHLPERGYTEASIHGGASCPVYASDDP